ncbi:3-deoxy-manno-octulosonate cytidylyltransferase [Aristophania vespae]|uniref:3-deoxy-manno-octulosonate cytidylyltransferase n=1 Tax=Aristophania vespae TaxID=2697033 RepID=A0A6P1NKQ4_9PROT|nr:3-deoxy-manno-octulosonate cytidylyltransferase [Aristophania vespae]QHI95441.1 3-deoxy-manno-octulosonate cytidylyltransferase [Aristophania vespae]
MRPIVIIPSRLASTRLPRKALVDINGVSMIERVIKQALFAQIGPVILASGDEEIITATQHIKGVRAVLTDPALPSGSDRVWAALQEVDPHNDYDVVINLQGDLPLFNPDDLKAVLKPLEDQAISVGTLVAPIYDLNECNESSIVKVACAFPENNNLARALYFSRQPIPWGEGQFWHHVGVYAWRREALAKFVTLPPSLLEQREKLEQLRALESGMIIGCHSIKEAPMGVDTEKDLALVRKIAQCQS